MAILQRNYRSPLVEQGSQQSLEAFLTGFKGAQQASMQADELASRKELQEAKAQEHKDLQEARSKDLAQRAKEHADAMGIAKQDRYQHQRDQALTQTQQMLESARGNPEVMQALRDRLSSTKALKLLEGYGDLNQLNPQQVTLFKNELGKIATGGVPTHAEMEALDEKTLKGKFAGYLQRITNEPSPANMGAFLKVYKDYLSELRGTADDIIATKVTRVIEPRKSILGDDYYNALKEQWAAPTNIRHDKPSILQSKPEDQQAMLSTEDSAKPNSIMGKYGLNPPYTMNSISRGQEALAGDYSQAIGNTALAATAAPAAAATTRGIGSLLGKAADVQQVVKKEGMLRSLSNLLKGVGKGASSEVAPNIPLRTAQPPTTSSLPGPSASAYDAFATEAEAASQPAASIRTLLSKKTGVEPGFTGDPGALTAESLLSPEIQSANPGLVRMLQGVLKTKK